MVIHCLYISNISCWIFALLIMGLASTSGLLIIVCELLFSLN